MILTKRQIIEEGFKGVEMPINVKNLCAKNILKMDAEYFIEYVYQYMHWKLEPIRKNTYIVT